MDNFAIFQSRLRELRASAKLSYMNLGKFINVSQMTIMRWEKGTAEPTLTNLCMLAQFFGVSVSWLVGEEY